MTRILPGALLIALSGVGLAAGFGFASHGEMVRGLGDMLIAVGVFFFGVGIIRERVQ